MQHKTSYIWGLIGKFGPAAIQLVSNMVMARYLTPSEFGTIGVLSIIIMVANVLIDSGLGGSLVKEREITKLDCSTITCFNICTGAIIYVILFFSAPYIETFFNIPTLSKVTRILSLTFLISPLTIVPKSILYRELKFKEVTFIHIASIAFAAATAITMAIMGAGIWSLVTFQLVNTTASMLLCWIISKYSFSAKFSKSSFKRLYSFGLNITLISIIDTIYENILTALTGRYMNVIQAGYLTQAKKLEESLSTSLALTLGNVCFPIITKLRDNLTHFKEEAISIYKSVIVISFPLLISVSIFSELIINILFGSQWIESAHYLSILIFAGMIVIMETMIRSFIKALDRVKELMKATIIKRTIGIIIILTAAITSPQYMVYGYVAGAFVAACINIILYCNLTNEKAIKYIINTIRYSIPCIIYYAIMKVICTTIIPGNFILQVTIAIIILSLYYIKILPLYGIRIIKK